MTEITRLEPHDPLPEGPGRRVLVMRRFDEDDPRKTITELHLTGGGVPAEAARPMMPDGTPMRLDDAIEAARRVAESEAVDRVYVVDRTAGAREQEIMSHGGDHSINMDKLQDTDPEDGEQGPDMRDRRP